MSIDFSKKFSLNCQNKRFGLKSVEENGIIEGCNLIFIKVLTLQKFLGLGKVLYDFSESSECALVEKVSKIPQKH